MLPLLLTLSLPASAADSSTIASISTWSTSTTLGVRATIDGDDDGDAILKLDWRKSGEATWRAGHPLAKLGGGVWAGSVLFLSPGTAYELRVGVSDPDNSGNIDKGAGASTLASAGPRFTGATIHVSPSGDDGDDGTAGSPVLTIARALELAPDGGQIALEAGTYHEGGLTLSNVFLQGPSDAVIDGSDPALDGATFTDGGDGVWTASYPGTPSAVWVDDVLLGDVSPDALHAGSVGWAVDGGQLLVRGPDGADPSGRVHASVLPEGVSLASSRLKGVSVRWFSGTAVSASGGSFVEDVAVEGASVGFAAGEDAASTVLTDVSVAGASTGLDVAGQGTEVRGATVTGGDVGVLLGGEDADVHDVTVTGATVGARIADAIDGRLYASRLAGASVGVSVDGLTTGPVFLVRDVVDGWTSTGLSYATSSDGAVYGYHLTVVAGEGGGEAVSAPGAKGLVLQDDALVAHGATLDVADVDRVPRVDADLHSSDHATDATLVRWGDTLYATLADFASQTGFEKHGLEAAPTFVDAEGGDFTPADGSALVDAGVTIAGIDDRTSVDAPDIGAVELGWTPPDDTGGHGHHDSGDTGWWWGDTGWDSGWWWGDTGGCFDCGRGDPDLCTGCSCSTLGGVNPFIVGPPVLWLALAALGPRIRRRKRADS